MKLAKRDLLFDNITNENLTIEVTNRCTSSCTHCFVRAKGATIADMRMDTASAIIDEAYALGYRNLHLTGGEPLLWGHLFDILNYAARKGFQSCFINTSGINLTQDMCARLHEFKEMLSFSISLQGPKELHEKIRGADSYSKTIRGIELALESGLEVNIFTTIGKSLLPHLTDYTNDIFKRFNNISSMTYIQLIRVAGDVFNHSDELLSPADFIHLVKIATMLNLYGYTVFILENPLANVVANALKTPWLHPAPPLQRSGRLVVLADGSLTLAHSSEIIIGNYNSGSLGKIVTSPDYRQHTAQDEITCPTCAYVNLCRTNQMLRPSEWYRDMQPEVPYCKRVLELLNI